MSKRKHIREFRSFQSKRKDIESINEAVIQRDDSFIVGGIQVDKKTINAYVKKVKDQTGKDLKSMYSEMQIAEELIRWSASNLDNVDNIPVSALMGGEEEMAEDIEDGEMDIDVDETGDIDIDIDVDEGEATESEDDTEGDEDFDADFDEDDFESPEDTEEDGDTEEDETIDFGDEDESPEDESGDDTDEEGDEDTDEDEDTDLPV